MTPLALLAVIAAFGGAQPQVVHADGRIGAFRIGVTTRAQLVAALGKPRLTTGAVPRPGATPLGVHVAYSCGTHCDTVYSFSAKTGKLSDFATESPRIRTEHGSHAGMPTSQAVALEGKPLVPSCAPASVIHVRWDAAHKLGVSTLKGRVTLIVYLGPNSTYVKPFC
jgi:hypothetical protein